MPTDEASTLEIDDWDKHWQDYANAVDENPAQRYRQKLIVANLAIPTSGARVVDIGSGSGHLIAELRELRGEAEYLGVELSESGVELASRMVPDATFVKRDLLEDAAVAEEVQGWATHAVCSEVLEHVEEPERLLRNARAYLRPGCRLVVTVPGGPRSAFDRHIGHRRHYTRGDLRELLERSGFDVDLVTGAGFPFFNLYRLVVVARGQRVVEDVAASEGQPSSGLARLVMRLFGTLFKLNIGRSRLGWQLVAVCREPG